MQKLVCIIPPLDSRPAADDAAALAVSILPRIEVMARSTRVSKVRYINSRPRVRACDPGHQPSVQVRAANGKFLPTGDRTDGRKPIKKRT